MLIDQEIEIRRLVRVYLNGVFDFEKFEDVFLDLTWDVRRDHDAVPEDVFIIERYIAELTGGYRTEDQLKHDLELLAPSWAVSHEPRTVSQTERGREVLTAG